MNPRLSSRSVGLSRSACALAASLALVTAGSARLSAQGEAPSTPLGEARTALEQWVENERILSAERAKWREGKALLEARIELVQQRIDALKEELERERSNVRTDEGRKDELVERSRALRAGLASLSGSIEGHEARVRGLLKQLPDPLVEQIRPLVSRLPVAAAPDADAGEQGKAELDLSQRYFTVLGIMTAVDKFNREIRIHREERTATAGQKVEVTALYVGLGQAYYASDKGDVAGVGKPTAEGWVWKQADGETAERIVEAIAVYQGSAPAKFVPVPIEVK